MRSDDPRGRPVAGDGLNYAVGPHDANASRIDEIEIARCIKRQVRRIGEFCVYRPSTITRVARDPHARDDPELPVGKSGEDAMLGGFRNIEDAARSDGE
jgi:hypothetical protein